jgi:cytochrome c oxidase subunit 2
MLVKVTARMWSWSFQYENGRQSGTLNLPLGRPVKLSITSMDMLHSLSIPAFRVKEDAVPGMETYLWFLPDEAGTYDLFCTEYCGTGHSSMTTTVEVMPVKVFESWYAGKTEAEGGAGKIPIGATLVQEKGCVACHSLDGTAKVGPTLQGLYGRKEFVVTAGKEHQIVVNEDYLKRSLLDPQADIVKGFPPIMPSQKGLLRDDEIEAIIYYLKNLR